MRRIAGGLVSWLTYQQVALRSPMYSERFVYTPIFELATARHWKARHEYSAKLYANENKKRLDFVFSSDIEKSEKNIKVAVIDAKKCDKKLMKVAALEIKYVSSKSIENASKKETVIKSILEDEKRLKEFTPHAKKGVRYSTKRYIILFGKENHLNSLCGTTCTAEDALNTCSLLIRVCKILKSENGRSPKDDPFGRVYYSSINFRAVDEDENQHRRWSVMVLSVSKRQEPRA